MLFGGAYDGAKPFDRPKYGALSVGWPSWARKEAIRAAQVGNQGIRVLECEQIDWKLSAIFASPGARHLVRAWPGQIPTMWVKPG